MLERLCFNAMYVWQPRLRNGMTNAVKGMTGSRAGNEETRDPGNGIGRELRDLRDDESGMGTIEVVLILVVLIALVIIFRKAITELLHNIFDQINTDAESVYSPGTN